MNAMRLAKKLADAGINIRKVTEGDDYEDGEIEITELVHVQCPTYGSTPGVVLRSTDGEEFEFYPERKASDVAALVKDIRKALGHEVAA